jgi:hypothetical protein
LAGEARRRVSQPQLRRDGAAWREAIDLDEARRAGPLRRSNRRGTTNEPSSAAGQTRCYASSVA